VKPATVPPYFEILWEFVGSSRISYSVILSGYDSQLFRLLRSLRQVCQALTHVSTDLTGFLLEVQAGI
jgi:hypothetical protein